MRHLTPRKKLVIEGVNVKEYDRGQERGVPIIFLNMIDAENTPHFTTLTERVMKELVEAIARVREWNAARDFDRDRSNWPGEG